MLLLLPRHLDNSTTRLLDEYKTSFTGGSAAGRRPRVMQTNYLRDEIEFLPSSTYVEVMLYVKKRREIMQLIICTTYSFRL